MKQIHKVDGHKVLTVKDLKNLISKIPNNTRVWAKSWDIMGLKRCPVIAVERTKHTIIFKLVDIDSCDDDIEYEE